MTEKNWEATHLIRWTKGSGINAESVINDYVMLIEQEVDGYHWAFTQQEWEKYKNIDKISPKFELSTRETSPITWAYNLKTKEWDYMKRHPQQGISDLGCEKIEKEEKNLG